MNALDCQTCGACCVAPFNQASFVDLDAVDIARLSTRYRRLHVIRGELGVKQDITGNTVCVALCGTVGLHVRCTIYARRPKTCSRFSPGSRECMDARRVVIDAGQLAAEAGDR